MNTQMNKYQNMAKNKYKENSKINTNKQTGSTVYSKNKKSLEKMLREYQTFCKKYFGESTPIGSMTEERMNKLLEDENNIREKELFDEDKQHFLETLGDNKESFLDEICDKLPNEINYSDNNILGNNKNNKNDYKQRNKIIFQEKKEEEKEKEKKNENEDDYNDFTQNENIEEMKNEKAKKIQNAFRNNMNKKKERIYLGYDKEQLYILKLYIDNLDSQGNITKFYLSFFSVKNQKNNFTHIDVSNLLKKEFISKEELNQQLEIIIEAISRYLSSNEKIKEMEGKEGDEEEYTF